jgi:hypothetical protein
MSMSEKRATGHKMASYTRPTVESASRHTTPEPMPASLSRPKKANQVGAPKARDGMSSSRYGHREGFMPNTGDVADPYDCKCEDICNMEPGALQGGD